MKVSIRDLSKMTGFSPATISNALNHKKGVNKETAEEIFRVAKETGYLSANAVTKIRLLIFKRNGRIIEDTPFFQSLIEGFEEECHRLGYEMVLSRADQRSPDYLKQVRELLSEQGAAVVVLATEMIDGDLEPYRNAPCPLVILDHWTETMEFNAVLINNADANATMEFLSFKANPTFSSVATLTFYGANNGSYLYEVRGNKLTRLATTWDNENNALVYKTRTLGSYVLSDVALNATGTVTTPGTSTGTDTNPPTGVDSVAAQALALITLSGIGVAMAFRKREG